MNPELAIAGLFGSRQDLLDTVRSRRVCYDSRPYIIPGKTGLIQIGYEIKLHGTFPEGTKNPTPDHPDYPAVERDVIRIAKSLSLSCGPDHMCGPASIEAGTLTFSSERRMRPDVTVSLPVFDQQNFGRPVDEAVKRTLHAAEKLLESAGVRKTRWDG